MQPIDSAMTDPSAATTSQGARASVHSAPAAPASGSGNWIRLIVALLFIVPLSMAVYHGLHRELSIETRPAGATVFVNGRMIGKSPIRVADLPAGSYSVRLEKEDYGPLSLPVVVGWGTTRLDEALPKRGTGELKVAVEPVGAEVLLDGELVGHTPLELSGVTVGSHELLVRKTNFKTYSQRVTVETNSPLEYKGIVLEDLILAMLQNAIDKEPQRAANYMDMGHYLFANNKIRDSAQFYKRGLHVCATKLTFAPTATPEERNMEQQLRDRDLERIHDELHKKMAYTGRNLPQKEMEEFKAIIAEAQDSESKSNPGDWTFVYNHAKNFIEEKKFDQAAAMYERHIEAAKGMGTVAQAHICLITLQIHDMRDVPQALSSCKRFAATHWLNDPAVARQTANAIYSNAGTFPEKERAALLAQAEALLRRALANAAKRSEMSALCKFELGNVMYLQQHYEEAALLYKDSVIETQEPSTKELRSQRHVDALRKLNRVEEAREVLKMLVKAPRPDIASKAQNDLKELETATPIQVGPK